MAPSTVESRAGNFQTWTEDKADAKWFDAKQQRVTGMATSEAWPRMTRNHADNPTTTTDQMAAATATTHPPLLPGQNSVLRNMTPWGPTTQAAGNGGNGTADPPPLPTLRSIPLGPKLSLPTGPVPVMMTLSKIDSFPAFTPPTYMRWKREALLWTDGFPNATTSQFLSKIDDVFLAPEKIAGLPYMGTAESEPNMRSADALIAQLDGRYAKTATEREWAWLREFAQFACKSGT